MKFKELPAGRIAMVIENGTLYGRTVANIGGKYYILDKYKHQFIPAGSLITNTEVKLVGVYNEDVCTSQY